ncbi:MAG: hypothetical protein FWF25_03170 [Propionibacteriaceae bacterium]|nr:hypothetical protein [Propionibacteriaceae bacterium]
MTKSINGTRKWLACLSGLALAVLGGNSLAMADDTVPASSQTHSNLIAAMHSEAFAYIRYLDYAEIAQDAGNVSAAQQLTATGQVKLNDQFVAAVPEVGLVGSDADNLKAAIDAATQASTKDYPAYASAATAAGDTVAAALFTQLATDVNSRLSLLQSASDVVTKAQNAPASVPAGPGAVSAPLTQGPAKASNPTTLDHLTTAMQNEAFAFAAYQQYSSAASANGDSPVCDLFMALGNVDRYESFRQIAVVYGLYGDTAANLNDAIAAETQSSTLNTGYATTATSENLATVADRFTTLAADDTNNASLLQQRYDALVSSNDSSSTTAGTTTSTATSTTSTPAATKPSVSTPAAAKPSLPAAGSGAGRATIPVPVLTTDLNPVTISPANPVQTSQPDTVAQQVADKNSQILTLTSWVIQQTPGSQEWTSGWTALNNLYHDVDKLQDPLAYAALQTAQDVANQKLADIAREKAMLNTLLTTTTPTSKVGTAAVLQIQALADQSSLITDLQDQIGGQSVPSTETQDSTGSGSSESQGSTVTDQSSAQSSLNQQIQALTEQGQTLIEQGQSLIQDGQSELGQILVDQGNALVQQGQGLLNPGQPQSDQPQSDQPQSDQPQSDQPQSVPQDNPQKPQPVQQDAQPVQQDVQPDENADNPGQPQSDVQVPPDNPQKPQPVEQDAQPDENADNPGQPQSDVQVPPDSSPERPQPVQQDVQPVENADNPGQPQSDVQVPPDSSPEKPQPDQQDTPQQPVQPDVQPVENPDNPGQPQSDVQVPPDSSPERPQPDQQDAPQQPVQQDTPPQQQVQVQQATQEQPDYSDYGDFEDFDGF